MNYAYSLFEFVIEILSYNVLPGVSVLGVIFGVLLISGIVRTM